MDRRRKRGQFTTKNNINPATLGIMPNYRYHPGCGDHTNGTDMPISSRQIRAARAMLEVKQRDLAAAAGVSLATLNNIERGVADPRSSTLSAIERALNNAGVDIDDDGLTEEVRLARVSRPSSYDTLFASQRILETIGPGSLIRIERIVFFARLASAVAETEPRLGSAC